MKSLYIYIVGEAKWISKIMSPKYGLYNIDIEFYISFTFIHLLDKNGTISQKYQTTKTDTDRSFTHYYIKTGLLHIYLLHCTLQLLTLPLPSTGYSPESILLLQIKYSDSSLREISFKYKRA